MLVKISRYLKAFMLLVFFSSSSFSALCANALDKPANSMEVLNTGGAQPNSSVLSNIVDRAKQTKSDTLLILQHGLPLVQYQSANRHDMIEIMSATKSIVSLAVGFAIDENLIPSVDSPVYWFFPEWNQGEKKDITIRHLLTHTSGLAAEPTTEEIYRSDNIVQLALDAKLITSPGSTFFYNNKATNLLSGIIQRVSGRSLDAYLKDHLFAPLEISKVAWSFDRAGIPYGMAGLSIGASDLAKIGQLMLQNGLWKQKVVISKSWINESTKITQSSVSQPVGLLWWLNFGEEGFQFYYDSTLLTSYRAAGIPTQYVKKLESIIDRRFSRNDFAKKLIELFGSAEQADIFFAQVRKAQLPDSRRGFNPQSEVKAFSARGYLGQYLVVIPSKQIVAVRQIHAQTVRENPTIDTGFDDFESLLLSL